jgi:hypothetical protein
MFNEHLEDLIKVETQDKIVLNTKETEFTPKLSTYMISPSRKLFFEAHSHQSLTQNSRKGFGSLGAYQGMGMGERNGRWDDLFIEKVHHQLFDRAADVWQP